MAPKKTAARKRKTARKKTPKKEFSQPLRILFASVFLLAFVAICLALLVGLREKYLAKPTLVYEEPVHKVESQQPATYQDVYKLVENQLLNGPHSMGWQKLPDEAGVQVRKIFGDFPSAFFLAELNSHIDHAGGAARLAVDPDNGTIRLFWQDILKLELRYRVPAPVAVSQRGRIAIIMDDMGGSTGKAKKLLEIDLPVTPAILPGSSRAVSTAALLKEAGREFMIHMPMQPLSYPQTNPGNNALLVDQSPEQIRRIVRSYIEELPGAVGGNNHMGSRFTEETGPMRTVLEELKQHGFFFIDSRTIGNSVAFTEARKMGLKTATRNIFLDNEENVPYIREQIRKMVSLAGNNREIIAICHPYKETFEALRQELPWLKQQAIEFVPASQLVHAY
ncbi:divergent polysaccharide deacetylase family protein [Pelobacter seleniigenes]|uniref:divergent polysaccharide deacetylase family protein n=1 Tax=Pelobacter seleniigenes TaxID=407188 RepID=UPI00068B73D4|nr:divergent polysaccharide deacetylase family protein [Pelobacter seleniigenes]